MGTAHDNTSKQHTVMATYRLKDGAETAFVDVLARHEATLRKLDLIETDAVQIFRQQDDEGRVTFVEVFTWRPGAVGRAHQHPEVAATWEVMEGHVETMVFPHYARWSA